MPISNFTQFRHKKIAVIFIQILLSGKANISSLVIKNYNQLGINYSAHLEISRTNLFLESVHSFYIQMPRLLQ